MAANVALVTERRFEAPQYIDDAVAAVLEEDRLLVAALEARGVTSYRVDWTRADVQWRDFDAIVVRTPWDYFQRFEAFCAWMDALEGHPCVLNDVSTLRWNIDKRYLLELEAAGLPIVPTVFVDRDEPLTLADAAAQLDTDAVVYKPTVGGGGQETYRVQPGTLADHEGRFAELTAQRGMMVQPFMPEVLAQGEVTVVAIDGEPTHALVKRARDGEFRVQTDHGGTLHAHTASDEELALTRAAMKVPGPAVPAYGRLDLVRDHAGHPRIMELEVVEPELWFRLHPPAAERFADRIVAALR